MQGAVALSLLGMATFLNAVSAVPTVSSLGVGQAWMPAVFAFASSVINLVANLLLIPRYGINGAAFASLLPQVLIVPVFVYAVTRMLKFSLWQLLSQGFLRPAVCAAMQLVVILALRQYVNSLVTLVGLCLASLGIYGLASMYGALTSEERSALFRIPARQQLSVEPEI
jgi:peptidoglycan biosynthesis protein MviN/MurJ (putative lipid II flippase)